MNPAHSLCIVVFVMKRTYVLSALAVLSLLVWIAQKTPMAFLTPNQADFVGGLTTGLIVGTAMAWWAGRAGTSL